MALCPRTLCVRLFQSWGQARNLRFLGNKVPADFLLMDNHALLAKWLCCFRMEARKIDGESYPPNTLLHYFMGIQRHIQKQKENQINLMTDKEFIVLRNLLDSLYRRLHSQGVGCNAKPTDALTREDEGKLWDSGVLNQNTPQGLLNCVFFLIGKNFCLCGRSEHCGLKLSQFCREVVKVDGQSIVQYTYSEHESKN